MEDIGQYFSFWILVFRCKYFAKPSTEQVKMFALLMLEVVYLFKPLWAIFIPLSEGGSSGGYSVSFHFIFKRKDKKLIPSYINLYV